jgi:hypothetical protein
MEYFTEPTLFTFLLQMVLLSAYIPVSYLAYRWACAPKKQARVREALFELDSPFNRMGEQARVYEFSARDYTWPVLIAWFINVLTFSFTHPYPIEQGVWAGILEELVNIFGTNEPALRAMLVGRFLFYGWIGAVAYSLFMIGRRFLDYDLTPRVYVYTAIRFTLAFVIGAVVGMVLGTTTTLTGASFDLTLATVGVVAFVIGFFPERGWEFLSETSRKALQQDTRDTKEVRLSSIEGMSIFQQGRLKQDGIENVQNLATANIPALITTTPFSVNQLIDWIDQAILLVHTSDKQFRSLEQLGIIRASDVLANTVHESHLEQLANSLVEIRSIGKDELLVLARGLQSALNMELVTYYRWKTSLNEELRALLARHPETVTMPGAPHLLYPKSRDTQPLRVDGATPPAQAAPHRGDG